jgi:glycosyltransferase involved in cell wall biosynthesis
MSAPLTVSVIIPTYNRANLVARAIRSALDNTVPGDEIIVVDDASTDHTPEVVRGFADPVRYVRAAHGGAGGARNVGLTHATGDLVAFLDSDDEWFADRLLLQRQFLARRPDVLFIFTDFCSKLDTGEEEHGFLRHWHKDDRSWDDILAPGVCYSSIAPLPAGRADFRVHVGDMFLREMQSDYIATSTVIARRREAGAALHFADDIRISEDKECFGRLAQLGPGAYFDCETSIQWGHAGPRVSDTNAHALVTSRLLLFDRIWGRDARFLAEHGEELRQARAAQYLKRARWLLARGRTREARADLRHAAEIPWSYRLLAGVPEPVARGLISLRNRFRDQAAM